MMDIALSCFVHIWRIPGYIIFHAHFNRDHGAQMSGNLRFFSCLEGLESRLTGCHTGVLDAISGS